MSKSKILSIVVVLSLVVVAWCGMNQSVTTPSVNEFPSQPSQWEMLDDQDTLEEINDDVSVSANLEWSVELALHTTNSILEWEWRRPLYGYNWTVPFIIWDLILEDWVPVSGLFVINLNAIESENASDRVIDHLKSDDFFDVENYPEATLEIFDAIETWLPWEFEMFANLTIKGITNDITFIAQFSEDRTQATWAFDIDRTMWDVRFGSSNFFGDLGDRVISNTINFVFALSFDITRGLD